MSEEVSTQDTPTPETQQVEEVEATTEETQESASGIDKALQKEQFKRANLEKHNEELMERMERIEKLLTTPDPEPAKVNPDDDLDALANAEDMQVLESTFPAAAKLLKKLATKSNSGDGISAKEAKELRDKIAYHEFWSQQPVTYRKDFQAEQKRLEGIGVSGARLEGRMDAWWERYLEEKTSGKTSTATKPAPRDPGTDKLVPAGTGAQPRQNMTLDEAVSKGLIHLATATPEQLKKYA